MAVTGHKGIDILQTANRLVFVFSLKDSAGAALASGTATVRIYELQSDGDLKSYDFNDNTFKTTALTTATATPVHQQGNNNTFDTGIWTYALTTLSGFTVGGIYIVTCGNASASPVQQERKFQFGSVESDFVGAMNSSAVATDGATKFMPVDANAPTFSVAGGVLTVKEADGTTTTYTKTVTSDAAAEPITGAS